FPGRGAIFTPDGKNVAVVRFGADVSIGLYNTVTGKEAGEFLGPKGVLQTLAFSTDGKTLTAEVKEVGGNSLQVWDTAKGKAVQQVKKAPPKELSVLAFYPGGDTFLLYRPGGAQLWSVTLGKRSRKYEGDPPCLSPDGRTLASASWQRKEVYL